MRSMGVAIIIGLLLLVGMTKCVDAANAGYTAQVDLANAGPTYILPRKKKARHIIRVVCSWATGRLVCKPGLGKKIFDMEIK